MTSIHLYEMNSTPNPTLSNTSTCTESDFHADTTCARKNMTLLSYTEYECNVSVFHPN